MFKILFSCKKFKFLFIGVCLCIWLFVCWFQNLFSSLLFNLPLSLQEVPLQDTADIILPLQSPNFCASTILGLSLSFIFWPDIYFHFHLGTFSKDAWSPSQRSKVFSQLTFTYFTPFFIFLAYYRHVGRWRVAWRLRSRLKGKQEVENRFWNKQTY